MSGSSLPVTVEGPSRERMITGMRLGQLAQFPMVPVTDEQLDKLLADVEAL